MTSLIKSFEVNLISQYPISLFYCIDISMYDFDFECLNSSIQSIMDIIQTINLSLQKLFHFHDLVLIKT